MSEIRDEIFTEKVKQPVSDVLYDMNKSLSNLIEIHYHMISKINDIQYKLREIQNEKT